MKPRDDIAAAINACFDCILQPDGWTAALDRMARALDSAGMLLYHRNPTLGQVDPLKGNRPVLELPMSADVRPLVKTYFQDRWYQHDHRRPRLRRLIDAGHLVVIEDQISTASERTHLKTYNELFLPFGFPGFAAIGVTVGGSKWLIPLLKGVGQGHFGENDIRRLRRLAPHFRRLIELSEKFVAAQATANLDMLEAILCAAILLDWRGKVVQMNSSAEQLVGDGLRVVDKNLVASDRGSNADLSKLIQQAVAARGASDIKRNRAVIVRREHRRPLLVDALPSTGALADTLRSTGAILLISDLEQRPILAPDRIATTLGLTRAESRLAVELGNGADLKTAADNLAITRETARSYLRSIFAKAETNRQSELVALLSRVHSWRTADERNAQPQQAQG